MKKKSKVIQVLRQIVLTIALPVIVYVVLGCLRPDVYFQWKTLIMLLTQTIPYATVGWAMIFGMSVGLFDFSVGSIIILASFVGIHMSQLYGLIGFVLGTLIASLVMGTFTGLVFAGLRIPSIITGFAALLIFESVATTYQNSFENIVSDEITIFGKSPGIYIVAVVTFILVYVLYNNTKFGYQIKAIGGNETVAKNMGIKSIRLKLLTYIIGGFFLWIASMVKVGHSGAISAAINMTSMTQVFTPMMGVMIGMNITSCNPIIGVLIGELTITIVSSGLVSLGIESRLQNVFVGLFLLLFIGIRLNSQNLDLKKLFTRNKVNFQTEGK
jgi:ribose transport system permease protein